MYSSGRLWPARKIGQLGLGIALAMAIFFPLARAEAQSAGQVVTYPPDTSHFPGITFNFEAYDSQGSFITSLAPGDVTILEDGAPHPAGGLLLVQPGLQLSLALNTGPTLAYTYNNVSRFEQVRKALFDWASSLPAPAAASANGLEGPDELSLISPGTSLATHISDPRLLAQALASYAPDLMKSQPSLASLIQALDLATDPLRSPMMKRAILYVTPLLPDSALQALPNLADRANQLGIHVFVWLVLPQPAGDNAVTLALKDLAGKTGGQFFAFTGSETFPDLNAALQPLRFYYQLSYTSAIQQSGAHQVSVRLGQAGQSLSGSDQVFTLNVQAPNPIFMDPPASVERTWVEQEAGAAQNSSQKPVLEPQSVQLELLVEFPDGFQRPLKAVRFFVDNKLVSEVTSPPFDRLTWSLQDYTRTASHSLRVEVEDQLGLVRSSIDTPVEVVVAPAPAFHIDPGALVLPAGGALAGLAIALGGVWLVRRRARLKGKPGAAARPPRPRRRLPIPVPLPAARGNPLEASAAARLMQVSENGHVLPGSAVPLAFPEITIGRDARKAAFVLTSTSVDPLHARLVHTPEGQFFLYDAGSIAGTWVNYSQVKEEGICLKHGDLVQFGRETFRFELNHPVPGRIAQVSAWEEN
jgi:hypothetical protein